MSAEIQDYLTNRITKGHVPSYQLYLHLNDVLKLATSIPPKYVCMTVFMYTYCIQMSTICMYTTCTHARTHACARKHTHTHTL